MSFFNFSGAGAGGASNVQPPKSFDECHKLVGEGLTLPAYDQAAKCSHLFNLLDARGAISVAERAQYIKRIRELACLCADSWLGVAKEAADA